jgi:hypothetical protein
MAAGEVEGLPQHRFDLRELPAEHAGDDVELGMHVLGIRLGGLVQAIAWPFPG